MKLEEKMKHVLIDKTFVFKSDELRVLCQFWIYGIKIEIFNLSSSFGDDTPIYRDVIEYDHFKGFRSWVDRFVLKGIETGEIKSKPLGEDGE